MLDKNDEAEAAAAVNIEDVEKRATVAKTAINDDPVAADPADYSKADDKASVRIEQIKYEENNHFTKTKIMFVSINFFTLFAT